MNVTCVMQLHEKIPVGRMLKHKMLLLILRQMLSNNRLCRLHQNILYNHISIVFPEIVSTDRNYNLFCYETQTSIYDPKWNVSAS